MTLPDGSTEPRPDEPAGSYSPYAVPLSVLLAGAYVAATEQVQFHPVSQWAEMPGVAHAGDGDGDGDGE